MEASAHTLNALWRNFECEDAARLGKAVCALARMGIDQPLSIFSDHPLGDEWQDFARDAVRLHLQRRLGVVYVVHNPVHIDLYKIGVTAVDISHRLRSLRTAGVVGEFHEVEKFIAFDRFAAESSAHRAMSMRTVRHKEFFVTDYATVIEVVRGCVNADNAVLSNAFPWLVEKTEIAS